MVSSHKICPSCGEEYVHEVQTCAECGVPLGREGPPPPPPREALPPLDSLAALRNAEVSWIDGLAHALAEEGIPSRVELPPQDTRSIQGRGMGAVRCTLYVRPSDVAEAARIDAEFARTQVPDLPEASSAALAETDTCPGCDTPVAADAVECPECGLAFAAD